MQQPVAPLTLLRRATSRSLKSSLCTGRRMVQLPYGFMTRGLQPQTALPTIRSPAIAALGRSLPSGQQRTTIVSAAVQSITGEQSRSAPAAAAALAAAAVASAAASGLRRAAYTTDAMATTTTPIATAASRAREDALPSWGPPSSDTTTTTTATTGTTTPSASSPSPSLEGTPVPWASLGPSLDLIQQRFRVGCATFRLIAPRDVDAVMDMYLDQGLLDADPYWTRAWPSAIALAATLLQRPELVRGKVVADLGAGLGLAGMAAAMAGAREVVLLDREPAALQCALLSAAATGLDSDLDSDPGSHRRVEPMPAGQRPPYADLQLTPPYRHLLTRGQPSGSEAGETATLATTAAAASDVEWQLLMALARKLGRNLPAEGGQETAGGQVGCNPCCDAAAVGACSDVDSAASWASGRRGSLYETLGDGQQPAMGSRDSHGSSSSSDSHCSSGSSSSNGSSVNVLRAHVFDWTAPPAMESLLPPPPAAAGPDQQLQPLRRGSVKQGLRQRRFDVVLACDVLYEDAAVGPISGLMPLLLAPDGGRLLLADPPNRTVRNRERFLEELRSSPLRLAVEECSLQQCEVSKLDNEMAGGLAPSAETVPVQFLVFRSSLGNETVGLKL